MHAIIPWTTTQSSSTDAGRRLSSAPIITIPTRTPKPIHIAADDLKVALDIQLVKPTGPVATSPVPVNAIKRVDAVRGLAILNRRKAAPAQEDSVSSLENAKTRNRMEALAKLEGRKPRPAQEKLVFAWPSSLELVRTLNRKVDLAKLEGRNSRPAQEDLVLAESPVCSLKRVRTINKRAGLEILARRESRKARLFGGPILQVYLRP